MGWRGTLRSMAAAARQADRDSQRRMKIATKQQMIASAASAVAEWEGYTGSLSRISIEAGDPLNWKAIAASVAPAKPSRENPINTGYENLVGAHGRV